MKSCAPFTIDKDHGLIVYMVGREGMTDAESTAWKLCADLPEVPDAQFKKFFGIADVHGNQLNAIVRQFRSPGGNGGGDGFFFVAGSYVPVGDKVAVIFEAPAGATKTIAVVGGAGTVTATSNPDVFFLQGDAPGVVTLQATYTTGLTQVVVGSGSVHYFNVTIPAGQQLQAGLAGTLSFSFKDATVPIRTFQITLRDAQGGTAFHKAHLAPDIASAFFGSIDYDLPALTAGTYTVTIIAEPFNPGGDAIFKATGTLFVAP